MTITLTSDASAHDALLSASGVGEASLDDVLLVDDELVVVRGAPRTGSKLLVGRGYLGTARAAHLSGAELEPFSIGSGSPVTSPFEVAPTDGGVVPTLTIRPGAGQTSSIIEAWEQPGGDDLILFNVGPLGTTGVASLSSDSSPALGVWQAVELADDDGNALFRVDTFDQNRAFAVDALGRPRLRPVVAPADAALLTAQLAVFYDSADGAPKLLFKAKTDTGRVVTAELSLS